MLVSIVVSLVQLTWKVIKLRTSQQIEKADKLLFLFNHSFVYVMISLAIGEGVDLKWFSTVGLVLFLPSFVILLFYFLAPLERLVPRKNYITM